MKKLLPLFLTAVALCAWQQRRGPQSEVFHTTVPARDFDVLLTRPTDRSVSVSVISYRTLEAYIEYDRAGQEFAARTSTVKLEPREPALLVLTNLSPDSSSRWRLRYRSPGGDEFATSEEWTLRTQRAPGKEFTFAVQADSHLDENASPDIYKQTLRNMLGDHPDFLVDLGDTFMTDKRREDFRDTLPQYFAQRYFFGLIGHSVPVFLALGNHDGEGGARHDGSMGSMAAWSLQQRRSLFPNPRPDAFYTGNTSNDPLLGPLENYYAWRWGDAHFLVLDPYWPTTARNRNDNWNWTLGEAQYRWLATTLADSPSRWKFVFIHHPVGGKGQPIRGGVEAALYNEWGGRNRDGTPGFAQHRPGWEMPVHQLLVKYGVTAVFHGHDHMFAREELDGLIYQLVPQPGSVRTGGRGNADEYGYTHGPVLREAGFVEVRVGAEAVGIRLVPANGKPPGPDAQYKVWKAASRAR